MRIGPYIIDPPIVLAPMAGVTDKPFRLLCRELGAGLCVSEMTTADPRLWNTPKSRARMDHDGEPGPVAVQIAGGDPQLLAVAARHNVDQGAQIIDINMGCPVKKVCNAWAGSALLQDESLVGRILEAVVAAVDVPVTLKIRTGWSREGRNALRVARLAEQAGIAALTIHGRTRDQLFAGSAEHETAAELVRCVSIPVIVNGDIDGPERAAAVLEATGAVGVMIGRAAQGRPWIFRELAAWLSRGERIPGPSPAEVLSILLRHVRSLHEFYGEYRGLRIARRHIGWYCRAHPGGEALRQKINRIDSAPGQLAALAEWFAPPAAAAA
ncbi:MAG: tRNA dihydrouridine synthase DusB [Chromatiales bacterium]|nr:tRNA dihydrouridine synthase DusB [Chromatiales bacterium]